MALALLSFISSIQHTLSLLLHRTGWPRHRKQGIWFLLFPDRENTGNDTGKNFETQGKYFSVTQGKI